jgi:hypothetical protein
MTTQPFVCPHWVAGQRCKPYFTSHGHGFARFVFTVLGVLIALAVPLITLATTLSTNPPPAPLTPLVLAWGIALGLTAVGSIFLTLHHEVDTWGCLVAGIGTPTLLVVVMTGLLPHL